MANNAAAVVFEGGNPQDEIALWFSEIRKAITLDSLEKLLRSRAWDSIILVTNYDDLGAAAARLGVKVHKSGAGGAFHFGRELLRTVEANRPEKVLYFSGASVPLLGAEKFAALAATLAANDRLVFANNVQSADLVAFTPAAALRQIALPEIDNSLGWLLKEEAGLPAEFAAPSAEYSFDVDTPGDLIFLSLHPAAGSRFRTAFDASGLAAGRLREAASRVDEPGAELFLAGRVGPAIVAHFNQNFPCRLRVFSEERGMKALGRQARGEVRSLLGDYLREVSPSAFFRRMAGYCSAAFIDTRVVFAAIAGNVSEWDRFNSDLGRYWLIKNDFVRTFTEAAVRAPLPVILGGHTAVAGGLWVLADVLRGDKPSMLQQA
ncbi:MAG: hypothetical protein ACOX8W_00125 [bacterium]